MAIAGAYTDYKTYRENSSGKNYYEEVGSKTEAEPIGNGGCSPYLVCIVCIGRRDSGFCDGKKRSDGQRQDLRSDCCRARRR